MATHTIRELRNLVDTEAVTRWHLINSITSGGVVTDGTLGSSHTATSHDFNLDITQCVAVIGNDTDTVSAATNFDVSNSGTADYTNWNTTNDTVIAMVIVKNDSGTASFDAVLGNPAPAANANAPSARTVDDEVGHQNWIKLATVAFTWDTATTMTVTVTADTPLLDEQPVF